MKRMLSVILGLICLSLFATPRGLTVSEVPCSDIVSRVEIPVTSFIDAPAGTASCATLSEDWFPSLNLDLNFRLDAQAQIGLNYVNYQCKPIAFGSMGTLSAAAQAAVAKAPGWMQAELSSVLASLDAAHQLIWAELILDTVDPYVDEVAFCIAHTSAQYLNSGFASPQLFLENAYYIYEIASHLDYVQVMDTGSAAGGGDYYSTTKYIKKDAAGELQEITVPQEIYYWYLVHPKLTDEIPAYINPSLVESNSNHSNNIADPPLGQFWRNYLYTLQQDGYPVLADTLSQCQTLFNRDGSGNDAIRTLQGWINQNMSFTSNSERPHQPVRIITKRIGRCGEYADLSSALARLALIPCTSILSSSTDHTWNEFWDEGWVAWEPVNGYIDSPLVYENGWGKVFGTVFEIRSDGLFTPVTDRYSEGAAIIKIQVVDSNLLPVDGARVVLGMVDGAIRYDCELFTDNGGFVNFVVGEGRNYRARVETNFGQYPEIVGTYTQLNQNSEDGQTYQYVFEIPAPKPVFVPQIVSGPVDTVDDHRFAVSYECPGYYITGQSRWDDINTTSSQALYYQYIAEPSDAAFMVMDGDAIIFWQIDGSGSAVQYISPALAASSSYDIPVGNDWYAFVDNSHRHRNAVKLSGAMLYERFGSPVGDLVQAPGVFELLFRYPNPFTSGITLGLDLKKEAILKVEIFNIKGQRIKSWQTPKQAAGPLDIHWDGCSEAGQCTSSGIYFIKISGEGTSLTRKALKF
ncbi:MAG: T9SS type A sorting domain-containing protein [Candidatus Cloacimonetes bacterium]|jgi:hypothetical protein|nr:T9SS type A sorting domain-containing protein [Candidatus Cloacimonadota bacterium]